MQLFRICAILAAGLVSATGASAQSDPPTTNDIVQDARLIITSNKGEVRLWHHAPRVLVLTNNRKVWAEIERIRDILENAISAPYGDSLFGNVTFRPLPRAFGYGPQRLAMAMRKGGPSGHNVFVDLGDGQTHSVDLVIAVAPRPDIAVLNGLWGMTPNATRAQMSGGRARCFYASRSRGGVRLGAYVSIVANTGLAEDTAECLWEEILHAMGPLIDAKDTPFFTFDDRAGSSKFKRDNDVLLLRALYESGTAPGDGPEKAIARFQELLSQQ